MLEIIILGIALSIDTFLICIPSASITKKLNYFHIFRISIIFALSHVFMISMGWFVGNTLKNFIYGFDHWISFGILTIIGLKTIFDAFFTKSGEEDKRELNLAKLHHIFIIAFATSVDALAIGISLIGIKQSIIEMAIIIGIVNFFISITSLKIGKDIGKKIHEKFEKQIVFTGGLTLIIIGTKILIQHLT